MQIILGFDIGGSTTKVVGFKGDIKIGFLQVRSDDQVTSFYGSFGKFLSVYGIKISDIDCILITGVGSSFINGDVYGIKTYKIDEFNAIGYGGLYLSGKKSAIVVSMGTGTAYVKVTQNSITHIGGSGVGGGTLIGLSEKLLNTTNLDLIGKYIENGSLSKVDLTIEDICNELIPSLPPDTTASNFGNIKFDVKKQDLALGIINMIYQNIGLLAIFYTKNDDVKDIVLTGSLTKFSVINQIFKKLEILHNVKFTIPDDAIFSTAIGTIIYYKKNMVK